MLIDLFRIDADAEQRLLIFVDRQDSADKLLSDLNRRGYRCNTLHGGKEQADRDSTISDFKVGTFRILIATSVAARGLDVKNLNVVLNYECPNHMEDYVHRVGRTGRAGNKGIAYTFITSDQERYAPDIVKALVTSKVPVPEDLRVLVEKFKAKVDAGNAKNSGGGFGGKGLERIEDARNREKKFQRKVISLKTFSVVMNLQLGDFYRVTVVTMMKTNLMKKQILKRLRLLQSILKLNLMPRC